jgi:hypothetical protein
MFLSFFGLLKKTLYPYFSITNNRGLRGSLHQQG